MIFAAAVAVAVTLGGGKYVTRLQVSHFLIFAITLPFGVGGSQATMGWSSIIVGALATLWAHAHAGSLLMTVLLLGVLPCVILSVTMGALWMQNQQVNTHSPHHKRLKPSQTHILATNHRDNP